jgi:hypothetical protein
MWISDFRENNGFQAFKAASYGIQKLIYKNFNNINDSNIMSNKKFGIVSSELILFENKNYLLLFTSLMQGMSSYKKIIGTKFLDYNSNKSFQIIKSCGSINKELNIRLKSNKVEYSMPLDLFIFEITPIKEKITDSLLTLFVTNNELIYKLTNQKNTDFLDLITTGLKKDKISNLNKLDITGSKIIKQIDFNLDN